MASLATMGLAGASDGRADVRMQRGGASSPPLTSGDSNSLTRLGFWRFEGGDDIGRIRPNCHRTENPVCARQSGQTGISIITVVPTARWLRTAIVPPFSSTFRLAMVRLR